MSAKVVSIIVLVMMILQSGIPLANQLTEPNQKNNQRSKIPFDKHSNQELRKKIASTSNYDLDVFPVKSEFTLEENVVIIVMLYTKDTNTPIMDSITVTTTLDTKIIQLTDSINQITLGKEDFVNGLNTLSVTYGDLTKSVEILRQDPVSTGPTTTTIAINNILNNQPAPGVPEKINFTINNAGNLIFPTAQNEYFQVSLNYQGYQLVVATNFYQANCFLENDEIEFTIPDFLNFQNYTFELYYSGNTFLASTQRYISLAIHNFTPVVHAQLTNTLIERSNDLNATVTYLQVKIDGYIQPSLHVAFYLNSTLQYKVNITDFMQNIPVIITPRITLGLYEFQEIFTYSNITVLTITTIILVVY